MFARLFAFQLSRQSSLLVWCKSADGATNVASHATTFHLRYVDVPEQIRLEKRAGEPVTIELRKRRASRRWCVRTKFVSVVLLAAIASSADAIDLQGHRGTRGLAPENTLTAFKTALAIGVTTLETDLALTRDGVLVLSHEPRLYAALTRGPDGRWLSEDGAAIFSLKADELAQYDIGRLNPAHKYAAQWTEQQASDGERIPTLQQLFELARDARSPGGRPVRFNIETKITPTSGDSTPDAERYARAVVDAVRRGKDDRAGHRSVVRLANAARSEEARARIVDGVFDDRLVEHEHGFAGCIRRIAVARRGSRVPTMADRCRAWRKPWGAASGRPSGAT